MDLDLGASRARVHDCLLARPPVSRFNTWPGLSRFAPLLPARPGNIHLHLSNALIAISFMGMMVAVWVMVKQQQAAKQRPSTMSAFDERPASRW